MFEALAGRAGRSETDDGEPPHPEIGRRIACDASVTRVVLSAASEPLDVGRKTPVVPPALRRALIVRDGRCQAPTCDRPPSWCDAHHVDHRADGGRTDLSNLILLCRPHHGDTHRGELRIEMADGRPLFFRRDGTAPDERAPP